MNSPGRETIFLDANFSGVPEIPWISLPAIVRRKIYIPFQSYFLHYQSFGLIDASFPFLSLCYYQLVMNI